MIDGWYYLHINSELIYKPGMDGMVSDIRESPFAVALWSVDTGDRECAWSILVEALSLGASKKRIIELAEKWKCTDEDADNYAERLGITFKKEEGFIAISPSGACGKGESKLEAIAKLCRAVGYTGGKMWIRTFKDCLKVISRENPV